MIEAELVETQANERIFQIQLNESSRSESERAPLQINVTELVTERKPIVPNKFEINEPPPVRKP